MDTVDREPMMKPSDAMAYAWKPNAFKDRWKALSCLIADVVSSRIDSEELWPSFLINADEYGDDSQRPH